MDHENIKIHLSAFYDGEISGAEKREIESHLEACAECRAAVANFARFSQALFAGAVPGVGADFTARVMERVSRAEAGPRLVRVPVRWLVPAMGIAAMLLLALLPSPAMYSSDLFLSGAGTDAASRWMFSGESPKTDDVLGFVMGQS